MSENWFGLSGSTHRFIIPDGINLSEKHDGSENGKEEALENEEKQEDNRGWWGEGGTLPPLTLDTDHKLVDAQEQPMETQQGNVQLWQEREI